MRVVSSFVIFTATSLSLFVASDVRSTAAAARAPARAGVVLVDARTHDVDPCPTGTAVVASRVPSVEQALVGLFRRAPVVFHDLTIGSDGRQRPITRANTTLSEAVLLGGARGSEIAKWYKAAVHRCGRVVAGLTWAFKVSFGTAPSAAQSGGIVFLARTRAGWHLYMGLSG